jgi:hypothetical protein
MRRFPASRSVLVLAGLSASVGIVGWAAQPGPALPDQPLIVPSGADASTAPAERTPGVPARILDLDALPSGVNQGALRHCSIIGAVRYPGTYAASRSSVLLKSLIEHAGGLTDHAAGTVRILQNGRQQQVTYSPDSPPVVVPPESVVIIDSAQAGAHVSAEDATAYTDIACVHLLDRPVVLWLKPEDATLQHLLTLLGQPAGAEDFVQVLQTPAGRGTPHGSLTSGSVVVFEPARLDRTALNQVLQRWPLQDLITIDETVASGSRNTAVADVLQFLQNGMRPATVEPVPEALAAPSTTTNAGLAVETSLPQSVSMAAAETQDSLAAPAGEDHERQLPLLAPPRRVQRMNDPVSEDRTVADASARNVTAVPASESGTLGEPPHVEPASAIQLRTFPESGPSPLTLREPQATRIEQSGVKPAANWQDEPARESISQRDTAVNFSGNGTMLGGLALGLLGGWGLMLAWSRITRRRTRDERTAERIETYASALTEPRITSPQSALDALIHNTTPILEEPAVPQGSLSFHGRSVGYRYLVRHGAHPLQGPHFAAVEARRSAAGREPVSIRTAVPASNRSPAGSARFERIDMPVQPAASRSDAATARRKAPAGVSPLEQALRNLMRGGRSGGAE